MTQAATSADVARAARLVAAISADDKTCATALLVAAESDYDEPEHASADIAAAEHQTENDYRDEPLGI